MSCPYQFYENEDSYYPMLYCKITTKPCWYRKPCDLEKRYIPIEGDDNCHIRMEQSKRNIPSGSYFVKATQVLPNGYYRLYVEVGQNIIEYTTNFKEFNQNYIYLKDNHVSLTPIKEVKANRKKKKTEE